MAVGVMAVMALGLVTAQQPTHRPVFRGRYGSSVDEHARFGRDLGVRFSTAIATTIAQSKKDGVLSYITPFMATAPGRGNYSVMLAAHNSTFPKYVAEVNGMSQGADVKFDDLMALNLGESLSTIADPWATRYRTPGHCSDYAVFPYIAHNEDGVMADENSSYWVDIEIDGANFTSFVYCGQLPSGAFGWNSHAVAFTLNYLSPYATDVHGMGRNFISRDLLTASSMADAVTRVTTAHPHATGHNFQILSYREQLLTNVEVAPHGIFKVTPFGPGSIPSFHANCYIHIDLPQYISASSKHRLARAATLPVPRTPAQMLAVLGDQADAMEPIFHDDLSVARGDQSGSITLTTMLFDMVNGTAVEYVGNPKRLQVLNTWRVL